MLTNRLLPCRTARLSSRGGFTLVELLVVIGIIAILAGVALGPITRGIKQAQESTAVQVAHQMGALEFAYSNDYNQTYPYDPAQKAENVANSLLNGGYANNTGIFYIANTPGIAKYTGATAPYVLAAANCGWDFWQNGTTGGLTSTTNDLTPLCQITAGAVVAGLPTVTGTNFTLTINTAKTAFGSDGIAVYYKGNNAVFVKCTNTGATTATNVGNTATVPYVGTNYADPNGATYTSIIP